MRQHLPRLLALAAGIALALAAAAGSPAASGGAPSAQDVNYLRTSISGDRFEIVGGRVALRRSGSAEVKALARRLIHDHSKSLRDAIALARAHHIAVPKGPTPSMVWELETVSIFSGAAFDDRYTYLEIKDHQQDVEEGVFEVDHGGSPAFRANARKELPTLRRHLALSKRVHAST
ncbi:MAG TPA: DUF4142 domain-containing protein [Gaiellaceae bacterium]|nr:DUF4142 domain-containing protein [Gaiellaceae bacterium]